MSDGIRDRLDNLDKQLKLFPIDVVCVDYRDTPVRFHEEVDVIWGGEWKVMKLFDLDVRSSLTYVKAYESPSGRIHYLPFDPVAKTTRVPIYKRY